MVSTLVLAGVHRVVVLSLPCHTSTEAHQKRISFLMFQAGLVLRPRWLFLMRTRCKYVYILFQLFLFQSAEQQKILYRAMSLSRVLQLHSLRNPLSSLNSNLLCFEICPVIGS